MNFTMILYTLCAVGMIASLIADRKKTKMALMKAWKSFENILPQLLAVFIIIGVALTLLTPEMISKLLGSESGIFGVAAALLLGSITLIPGFVAFPLAAALLHNGAGYAQIAAFVTALMTVGIITIPVEMKYFGKKAAILRNALCFVLSLAVALLMGVIFQ